MNAILNGPVDTALLLLVEEIDNKQSSAKSRVGRYLQVLASHVDAPEDGVPTTTRVMGRPSDEREDLGLSVPGLSPVKTRVNVYDGPFGDGYEIIAEARVAGQLYKRVIATGEEGFREQDWVEVFDE